MQWVAISFIMILISYKMGMGAFDAWTDATDHLRLESETDERLPGSPTCGHVDRIFLNSLRSRSDRHDIASYLWTKLKQNSKCRLPEIRLVEAFDRDQIQDNDVVKYLHNNGWKGFGHLSEGAVGAYLSNYQLWLHLNATYPNEVILVAEDDMDAYTYSMDMLDEILSRQQLPADWHVLWIASTRHDNPDPDTRISMNLFKSSRTENVWGTQAYILSPAGVRRLLHLHRLAFTDEMHEAVDVDLLGSIQQGKLESFYVLPKLFSHIPREVLKSSIKESGPVPNYVRKTNIIEPLMVPGESLLSSINSSEFTPLRWEAISHKLWTALFST